jgi:hypothetical protein
VSIIVTPFEIDHRNALQCGVCVINGAVKNPYTERFVQKCVYKCVDAKYTINQHR